MDEIGMFCVSAGIEFRRLPSRYMLEIESLDLLVMESAAAPGKFVVIGGNAGRLTPQQVIQLILKRHTNGPS